MKLYELAAKNNPAYLLDILGVTNAAATTAFRLDAVGQKELSLDFLKIVEFFSQALHDEATIQPSEGIGRFLTDAPQSLRRLSNAAGITTPEGRRAAKRELKKLIKSGVAVMVARSYALAGKPESTEVQ